MTRLTKLEREALLLACGEILAGDACQYFNYGCEFHDPPRTPDEKRAVKLASALASAHAKLRTQTNDNNDKRQTD